MMKCVGEHFVGSSEKKRLERKQRKQKQRQLKYRLDEARKSELRVQKEIRSRLPDRDIVQIDKIDDELLEVLTEAWQRVALSKEFKGERADDLQLARERGFYSSKLGPINWGIILGQLLHRELTSMLEPVTLRRHDFEVHATARNRSHVNINVRALESVRPFVACSPKRPSLRFSDKEVLIAYNLRDDDHFIRRLEERSVVEPSNYICKGQVFACLYRWQYFEALELPNGQKALKLWNWCDPKTLLGDLWKELLPVTAEITDYGGLQFFDSDEGRAYYLVGYCPIDERLLDNGVAILNTLLLPGMDNTPEASIFMRGMSTVERFAFSKRASLQTMKMLSTSKDFSLIREFNQRIPQVRFIKEDVFNY